MPIRKKSGNLFNDLCTFAVLLHLASYLFLLWYDWFLCRCFCAAIEWDSVSLLRFLFLSHIHVSSCEMLLIIIIIMRKRSFFQAAVVSILLYGCTIWTSTKRMEKKLDGNYTRILRAILNKSWRQQPTKQQLHGYLPPITKTIKVRRTRHARHCWRSRDELISDVPLPMAEQEEGDQLEPTYISSV